MPHRERIVDQAIRSFHGFSRYLLALGICISCTACTATPINLPLSDGGMTAMDSSALGDSGVAPTDGKDAYADAGVSADMMGGLDALAPMLDGAMDGGISGDGFMGDAVTGDAVMGDAVMGDAVMGDAVMGDAVMGDTTLMDGSLEDAEHSDAGGTDLLAGGDV